MMGKEKPIWRLAFFSRLEERKGIKLFVDAVSSLNVTDEKFEVIEKPVLDPAAAIHDGMTAETNHANVMYM